MRVPLRVLALSAGRGGVALALCACVAGCALPAPSRPRTVSSPVAVAQARHEYPATAPAPPPVAAGFRSPIEAVAAFADAYINWSARTVPARMQALARISVGQARSAVQLAAAQTAQDYELRRAGIANSGQVEAVCPFAHHPLTYIVVTRERTTATATTAYQGLRPAWHVAIAAVAAPEPGVWVVSGWQPEG